jgi:glycosyltransferase involved in cell wall biosynthesis
LEQLEWPLVDQSDPPALAAAIEQVARMSSSEQAKAAESGRRLVEKQFTREVSASRVEALYDSLRGMGTEKDSQ